MISIIYKAATGTKRTRNLLTPVGLVFFFGFLALLILISLEVDKILRLPPLVPTPLNFIVSPPVLAIGIFLILWSIHHFIKARGTPVPLNPPPKLVTTGPYAHIRNPMLTGLFIFLFGLGVLIRSASLVFIFTPLFILLNVLELKAIEEPELEKRFGKHYIQYKQRVPMFIPRLEAEDEEDISK